MNTKAFLKRPVGSLYAKILVSFVFLLLITLFAIFSFYLFFSTSFFETRIDQLFEARQILNRRTLNNTLFENPSLDLKNNAEFRRELEFLSSIYNSKIWVTDSENNVVLQTFPGVVPRLVIQKIIKRGKAYDQKRYYRFRSHIDIYLTDDLTTAQNKTYKLHQLYIEKVPERHGAKFAIGLLSIGFIIAVFAVPISRLVSRPIKSLTKSAIQLGKGDLSHRVVVKSADEIEELGNAFNQMANQIETMVESAKELNAQVSHELRSPLARIRIAVELLKEGNDFGKNVENPTDYLKTIQDEVEELDYLIGRILEYSKLDIRKEKKENTKLEVANTLNGLIGRFQVLSDEKQLKIRADIDPDLVLMINHEFFKTGFTNLIDNAIKYTPVGGEINFASRQDNQSIFITIENSSELSEKTEPENLFQPFYRANKADEEGTGLGLAITRKAFEKAGGAITASIKPGWFVAETRFRL